MPLVLHKFGGSSLATADCFRQVAKIVMGQQNTHDRVAVVVSAMGGKPKVTDMLLGMVNKALDQDEAGYKGVLEQLKTRHWDTIAELIQDGPLRSQLEESISNDLVDIGHILKAASIMRIADARVKGIIGGHGELWSAQILAAMLSQATAQGGSGQHYHFLDARKVLVVTEDECGIEVMWEATEQKLPAQITSETGSVHSHMVITGFIASTEDGVMTTLQRDGSDFSASIFGKLLKAESVTIWTDVSGVLSADPRKVANARYVSHLSYNEAMELAYFGAKVIHPSTMRPAVEAQIPLHIRNTFEPGHKGTCISMTGDDPDAPPKPPRVTGSPASKYVKDKHEIMKGLTSIDSLALFNLEGVGMMGVPGIATRLFGALHKHQVNVIFIAQASSEHSICFAIPMEQAELAKTSVEDAFFKELHYKHIQPITYASPVSVIAMVGDNMSNTPGVSGMLFSALGGSGVNVMAISQGSSQRNISAVVSESDSATALQAIHDKMTAMQVIQEGGGV